MLLPQSQQIPLKASTGVQTEPRWPPIRRKAPITKFAFMAMADQYEKDLLDGISEVEIDEFKKQ